MQSSTRHRVARRWRVALVVPLALGIGTATLAAATAAGAAPATKSASPWTTQASLGTAFILSSVVACASPLTCYALGSTDGEEAAAFLGSVDEGQSWTPASIPAVAADFDLISCPALLTCFISGLGPTAQLMYETKTAGLSWTAVKVPSTVDLTSLACSTPTGCVAGGFSLGRTVSIVTVNAGASWTTEPVPNDAVGNISCPSQAKCFAVSDGGSAAAVTTDGAKAWRRLTLPAPTGLVEGVSCPSTRNCFVVGAADVGAATEPLVLATTNGGRSWKPDVMPGGLSTLLDVSCPSVTVCVAISSSNSTGATSAVVTTDGGAIWKAHRLTVESNIFSFLLPTGGLVACPSTSLCITSGALNDGTDRMLHSGNGGATWQTSKLPVGALVTSIGCSSSTACAGLGIDNSSPVTEVRANGITWAGHALSGFVAIGNVRCTGPDTCVGLAEVSPSELGFARTTDGGDTWTKVFAFSFDAGAQALSLDCLSAADCYATFSVPSGSLGSSTVLERSTDGGMAWKSVAIPKAVAESGFGSVACSTTAACTISNADGSIEYSTDAGRRWANASIPHGLGQTGPMSCGSATTCVTTSDGSASAVSTLVSTDAGARWKTAGHLPSGFAATALVCPTASDCELLGSSSTAAPLSYATKDGGSSWALQGSPAPLGNDGQWLSLACPAVGRCAASAVGPGGSGYLFGLG